MKKTFKMLCMLVAAIAVLTGCGSNAGSTTSEGTKTSESGGTSDEKITIKYLQWQQEFQTAAVALAEAYMEQNPNVTIEVNTVANSYFENLKTTLASGEIPEIFVTEGYNNMKAYSEYITDLSDQPWVASVKEQALPCITLDGKVMGMPITMAGEGIVYNKKMFAEHGWEIPTTLSEFEALCAEIEAAGIQPLANQFGDDWLIGQFISAAGYAYIPEVDKFTEELYAGNVKLADNEQMQKNLEVLDILLKYGQEDSMAYGWNEVCTAFATEECAMVFEGDWIWDTVYPINPDIECGIFAIPTTENPEDSKMIVDANGLWHVGKGSKNAEAAKEYLNWIYADETAREIMLTQFKVVPVFDGEGWEFKADNKLAESTIEYLDKDMVYPWSWPTWPDGFRPSAGKIYQDYIAGKFDKQQTLEELDNIWSKLASGVTE
jgi:ABC-type sugar transport system, periplasmic component